MAVTCAVAKQQFHFVLAWAGYVLDLLLGLDSVILRTWSSAIPGLFLGELIWLL